MSEWGLLKGEVASLLYEFVDVKIKLASATQACLAELPNVREKLDPVTKSSDSLKSEVSCRVEEALLRAAKSAARLSREQLDRTLLDTSR